jgi:hypothetical protein
VKNYDVGCGGYASTNCILYELKKISRVLTHELIDNIQIDIFDSNEGKTAGPSRHKMIKQTGRRAKFGRSAQSSILDYVLQHICFGNDAYKAIAFQDRQAADLLLHHLTRCFLDARVGGYSNYLLGHDFLDLDRLDKGAGSFAAESQGCNQRRAKHIALTDDPNDFTVVDNRHMTDPPKVHNRFRQIQSFIPV